MALAQLSFFSHTLRRGVGANVILPQENPPSCGKTRKTLYLLHGLSDDHTMWSRRTSIERYAEKYGIFVVMPDGGRGWYTDACHGEKFYTFMTEELPAVMRSFFAGMSERREDNYIAGLSMGGFGAMKIALHHPDRFAGAASLSGALDVERLVRERQIAEPTYWNDIFGSADAIPGSDHDVFLWAKKNAAALDRIYLGCGYDDDLLDSTKKMDALLCECGVPHEVHYAPGAHNWVFWDAEIVRVLDFFFGK